MNSAAPTMKKSFVRFDTIQEYDGRTDGGTDRQTSRSQQYQRLHSSLFYLAAKKQQRRQPVSVRLSSVLTEVDSCDNGRT